jgi:23S rRNA (adenine2030-N6)-methyltransferase
MQVLHEMNPDGQLRYYPGSPELARRLTRPQDRVLLNEKHPEDGVLLKDNMAGDRRVKVHWARAGMCRGRCCRCRRSVR